MPFSSLGNRCIHLFVPPNVFHIIISLRFKRPLVRFPWRNPLWTSSSSASIFPFMQPITIFNSSFVTWLIMLIVLYSWHLVAFGFLGIGIHIDYFGSFGQYPVLYMSLHNCVNFPSGPSSNVCSISAAIKSVPVALLFFNCLMACFTYVDVIEGQPSSLISGRVTLSSAYNSPMYTIQTFTGAYFSKHMLSRLSMIPVVWVVFLRFVTLRIFSCICLVRCCFSKFSISWHCSSSQFSLAILHARFTCWLIVTLCVLRSFPFLHNV